MGSMGFYEGSLNEHSISIGLEVFDCRRSLRLECPGFRVSVLGSY